MYLQLIFNNHTCTSNQHFKALLRALINMSVETRDKGRRNMYKVKTITKLQFFSYIIFNGLL